MPNNFEQQWAQALQKSRLQQTKRQVPLAQKRTQIEEELTYFKEQLKRIVFEKKPGNNNLNYYLRATIKVRAKLMALRLEEEKARFGFIGQAFLEKEYKKYQTECQKLLKIFTS